MVSATAASMDGYSSFGAALLVDGFKKTLECAAPLAVVADVQVLQNAPPEMTAAGYGDLLGKITAGADWIISDILEAEPIDPFSWRLSQRNLRRWVARPLKLVLGDSAAFTELFEGLTMTGFAMQALQSSRPASGSEHLFSHIWEMQHLEKAGLPVSHGFKVALGTLASAAMRDVLLAQDVTPADVEAAVRRRPSRKQRDSEVRECFWEPAIAEQALETSIAKHISDDRLRARLLRAAERWDVLRRKVRRQLIPFTELRDMLRAAACPTQPEQIGLSRERLGETFRLAQMIRPRYTVLDLAYELGRLDECVQLVLAEHRYFGAAEAVP
jgi:glycerol-1-phosphate dehydrogenase [NAD(P)+]